MTHTNNDEQVNNELYPLTFIQDMRSEFNDPRVLKIIQLIDQEIDTLEQAQSETDNNGAEIDGTQGMDSIGHAPADVDTRNNNLVSAINTVVESNQSLVSEAGYLVATISTAVLIRSLQRNGNPEAFFLNYAAMDAQLIEGHTPTYDDATRQSMVTEYYNTMLNYAKLSAVFNLAENNRATYLILRILNAHQQRIAKIKDKTIEEQNLHMRLIVFARDAHWYQMHEALIVEVEAEQEM